MLSLDVIARIQARVGADAAQPEPNRADPTLLVPTGSIRSLCQWLKDDTEMAFDHLMCLSGVDWPDRIEVVYHFFSHQHRHRIVLKVRLSRENPSVDSVSDIWGAANWHEREAYDLFGIRFQGHPDLRRILLPDDWAGHPLRKDYVFPTEYHGVACDSSVSGPSPRVCDMGAEQTRN